MPNKKKRVWTEEHFRSAFKDMGAKAPKASTPNPEMHSTLVKLLKSRDTKADVDSRLRILLDIADKGLTKPAHKAKASTTDVISNCATFGTGYDSKAKVCKNCEDGPEIIALCKDKTASFKKDNKAKEKKEAKPSMNTKKTYESLEELRSHMKVAPCVKMAQVLDQMIVLSEFTLDTIEKKLAKKREELSTEENPNNEFTKRSRIMAHFNYRQNHNLWQIEWAGVKKNIPKVIGIGEVQVEPPVEKVAAVG